MASRLVRDASGGFSFFGKMQKSDLKILETEILPDASETKMHPNPG